MIIRGKVYDPQRARLVGKSETNERGGKQKTVTMHCKRTGEYFIAEQADGQIRIYPLEYPQAKEWAKAKLDAKAYNKEFGKIVTDVSVRKGIYLNLTASTTEKLRRLSRKKGITIKQYITRLIEQAASEEEQKGRK